MVKFSGKQEFFQTSLLGHCDVLIYPQRHAKYQKNLTIMQVWKTGQFRVCSAQFLGKQKFSQTSLLFHFKVIINPQLHAKYQKNIVNQSLENYVSFKNGPVLGIFGPILGQTRILSK